MNIQDGSLVRCLRVGREGSGGLTLGRVYTVESYWPRFQLITVRDDGGVEWEYPVSHFEVIAPTDERQVG